MREFQAQGFIFCRPPPRPLKVLGDLRIGAGARGIVLIDQMKQIQHRRSGTELTPPSNTAKSCKCSSAVMRSAWHADLWMVTMGNLLALMRSNTAVRGSPALQFHCRRGGPRTAAGGRLQLGNDGRSREATHDICCFSLGKTDGGIVRQISLHLPRDSVQETSRSRCFPGTWMPSLHF